jgi:hypothetical protein
MKKLSLLRTIFVVYIIVKTVIETAFEGYISNEYLQYLNNFGIFGLDYKPYLFVIFVFIINFVILLPLGFLVFHFLLKKMNWARILLLIIGWLTVLDALYGLIFAHQVSIMVNHINKSIDLKNLMFLDRITDILGLLYYSFLIYTLQFSTSVKQLFLTVPEETPM